MSNFELKFTDKNNVLRIDVGKSKGAEGFSPIQIGINDRNEPGAPNVINLNKDQVRVVAKHLLSLIGE